MGAGEWVALVSRWLHIVGAITAVGGAIFALFVALPASDVLSPDAREAFHAAARKRWSKVVMVAIAVLLVSGLYNFIMISKGFRGELPSWYHKMFGAKFILAMVVFAIASLLAGRTELAKRLRANMKCWLSLNLLLAAVIIALSGVMRTAHPPVPPVKAADAVGAGASAEPVKPVAQSEQ